MGHSHSSANTISDEEGSVADQMLKVRRGSRNETQGVWYEEERCLFGERHDANC